MSNNLMHNDALVYAIGLNDLNIAADLLEEKLEHTNSQVEFEALNKQLVAVQKAIAQWDDRFLDQIQDQIRIK